MPANSAAVSAFEAHFNALPRIRVSDSRRFAAEAKAAIATALPRWREYAIRRSDGAEDDDVDPDDMTPTQRWLSATDHRHSEDDYLSQIVKTRRATGKSTAELEALVGEVAKQIVVHTNAELSEHLKRAADWLESKLSGERWVALTERLEKGEDMKSTEWALSVAWKHLSTKPWCVTDLLNSRPNGLSAALSGFYERGVRHYAMFDDAAYSGAQKASQVFLRTLRFLREAAAAAGDDPVSVYVAIPFFTDSAMKLFASRAEANDGVRVADGAEAEIAYAFPGGHRVIIWTGGSKMPSLIEILQSQPGLDREAALNIHKILFGEAGSLCIFQHKIPDYLSLPWMYGATFQRAMTDHYARMPPYNPAAPRALSSPRASPEAPKTFECFAAAPASGGAPAKIKFNGRLYAVRTGARGGRYITVAGAKRYV
jgi:hypothetical protein